MKENKVQKADRLVVKALNKTPTGLIFEVQGDSGDHTVIIDYISDRTTCDCRYTSLFDEKCSHILTVEKYMTANNIKEE
jgi:hypothetical protein